MKKLILLSLMFTVSFTQPSFADVWIPVWWSMPTTSNIFVIGVGSFIYSDNIWENFLMYGTGFFVTLLVVILFTIAYIFFLLNKKRTANAILFSGGVYRTRTCASLFRMTD